MKLMEEPFRETIGVEHKQETQDPGHRGQNCVRNMLANTE